MSEQNNEVVNLLRGFAKKLASAPDRMTTADGQGGISTMSAQPKYDAGEGDLKQDLPNDGTIRKSTPHGGAPDRMTVAGGDGQGGISASQAQPKTDDGEAELKQDLPTDGTTRKSARVEAIRTAILGANPSLAPAAKAAPAAAPATGAQKQAGNDAGQPIDLSQDLLAKIASEILATEEGINFVYSMREKAAGASAAKAELTSALHAAEFYDQMEQVKSAAFHDVFSKAAAIHDELVQLITEADADEILKTAAIHQAALAECGDSELFKSAYAAGMDDAALMDAAGAPPEGGGEGAPPEGGGELPMSGEGGLGEEEILALLQELIASGELTEEEVMQALAESEGGAPAGEEGAPPSGEEGGAAPEPPAEEEIPAGPASPMG